MANPEHLALLHADIDGELDAAGRAELARLLFADAKLRRLRDELKRTCTVLDAVPSVDPPAQLRTRILDALPQSTRPQTLRQSRAVAWRIAALAAGVLVAAAVFFESGTFRAPAPAELAGTLSAPRAALDAVQLADGPVAGRVGLYRDGAALVLEFELVASDPVDVVIASGGETLRLGGLGRPDSPAGPRSRVRLTGPAQAGRTVEVSFLIAGRPAGTATLRVPEQS